MHTGSTLMPCEKVKNKRSSSRGKKSGHVWKWNSSCATVIYFLQCTYLYNLMYAFLVATVDL